MRVIIFNVCRFGIGGNTLEAIGRELRALNPSIICMNEVDASQCNLDSIDGSLGTHGHTLFFGQSKGGKYGNAVWGKHELEMKTVAQVKLRGGVSFLNKKDGQQYRIQRGLLVTYALTPGFYIAHSHLDHIDEDERSIQLLHILEETSKLNGPVILCGDFNSLTRQDYSDTEWQHIVEKHETNGWKPPRHTCLDLLKEYGFEDCFRKVTTAPGFTSSVEHPHIRIDYCFANQAFLKKFTPRGAFVAKHITLSDHFPLVLDFENFSKI